MGTGGCSRLNKASTVHSTTRLLVEKLKLQKKERKVSNVSLSVTLSFATKCAQTCVFQQLYKIKEIKESYIECTHNAQAVRLIFFSQQIKFP